MIRSCARRYFVLLRAPHPLTFGPSLPLRVLYLQQFSSRKLTSIAMAEKPDYSQWSHERLQERIRALDIRLEHLERQMAKFVDLGMRLQKQLG